MELDFINTVFIITGKWINLWIISNQNFSWSRKLVYINFKIVIYLLKSPYFGGHSKYGTPL